MLKTIFIVLLPFLGLFGEGQNYFLTGTQPAPSANTGTLKRMIASSGSVVMDLDLGRNGGRVKGSNVLNFEVERDSFFSIVVFDDELRGPLPGTMALTAKNSAAVPARLNASLKQLVVETLPLGGPYQIAVRDSSTGYTFFNVEGQELDYDAGDEVLNIQTGRLLLSKEFAADLGREAGTVVGQININAKMSAVEVSQVVDGEIERSELPPVENAGNVPGPDVVVGDLNGLAQFGSQVGSQVGLAVGTDSCNFGIENLHWFANPNNDHPVIPQNLYRMSGGATNDLYFEQIGQSNVKHAFTALTQNLCGLGCNGVGGSNLGSGCSDPYDAGLNAGPNLGSRAFINPFTGFYPRNDSATPNNSHSGHSHVGTSHRILTNVSDLVPAQNPGATYYAEAQYITPHEYAWCTANPTQCNQYNNVSYRRYNVNNSASPFSFSPVGSTQRTKTAISAWTGATVFEIRPAPGTDGIAFVGYKVTQTSPGVWHYEYAIYNQNLDRGIQSFSVPVGAGVTLSNVGFHMPPQHPGWANDGTVGNTGFSSTPWTGNQSGGAITWGSEMFASNPNANAIRWGTLYNFRFDSNRPPATMNATIGYFKTGSPSTVQVQGPSPVAASSVNISGRVFNAGGYGMGGVQMVLTDSGGNIVQITSTSSFGYYSFANVASPGTYTITPSTKRASFTPRQFQVSDNIADADFTANP